MQHEITLTLPDQSKRVFPKGTTGLQVAESISSGLARNAISYTWNKTVLDLSRELPGDGSIAINTWDSDDGKATFWHSSAHILAEAVQALFPEARFGIGPSIETGFYYDIDFGDHKVSPEDLVRIEKKMQELVKEKQNFNRKEVPKAEAVAYFTEKNDPYKLELINDLEDGTISFYTQGSFTDLCRGPHIPDTSIVKAIKLMSIAGAYWRGDERNKQLTRIYGVTFPKKSLLDEYLIRLEEAKKRDHRVIGKDLELFTFSDLVGKGLPLWLPKGTALRERLEQFLRTAQVKAGYSPVVTPHIGNKKLYVTSGHWEKYGKDSFQPIHTPEEGEEFLLKPMNCPHHCEIYKAKPRSYRDLPLRLAEFGTVYRYEQSGELHGLTRVRGFTQDDAHIFCRPDQVREEFAKVIDLVLYVFQSLGFYDYTAQISLRDPENKTKYIGSDEAWDEAESAIKEVAAQKGLKTVIEEGEAAFYGPKLDFMVRDAIGRKWQLGTIQVDYQLPNRFELEYTGSDNQKHRPVMIHRAPFGSLERFVAVLIEHCGGEFPLWLTPDQVTILPISEKFNAYASEIQLALAEVDIRGIVDLRDEKIGKKIRDAELMKLPFMLVVGQKEEETKTVSVRQHKKGDVGNFSISDFISFFKNEALVHSKQTH